MKQNEPSLKTAEFSAAKKLSVGGTTEPRYRRTSSGWSWTASENEQKMIPRSFSVALNVVATETESKTASTVIEINYEPAVIIESDPGVPEPKLKNVVEPLPKRPEVAPSGKPIQAPTSKPIEGGTPKDPTGPKGVPIKGPKPRPIDGYEVDENAQEWR